MKGNPSHKPTPEQRKTVHAMCGFGVPQQDIARVLGIDPKTLRLHYRNELDSAVIQANTRVAQSLFQMATTGGNVAAAIFWMKSRAGWRERHAVEVAGPDGGEIPLNLTVTFVKPTPLLDGTAEDVPAADRGGRPRLVVVDPTSGRG